VEEDLLDLDDQREQWPVASLHHPVQQVGVPDQARAAVDPQRVVPAR
jgi:hypothetical protein